jgi:pilus assembly protein Flp/PilA
MLTFLKAWFATRVAPHLPKDEKGQDAAEYALLIGLIALAIVLAVTLLGTNISALFGRIAATVGSWAS